MAAYIRIARIDHWVKNVFVLPGFLVALSIDSGRFRLLSPLHVLLGFLAICLVSSSNYVLNEILDAPFDRFHPSKSVRPVPSGEVQIAIAYVEWIGLMLAGIGLGFLNSFPFTLTLLGLWLAGCLYNLQPFRLKNVPYLDVFSEAINNPLRMLAGWYLTQTQAVPITTLLISYWMGGCYFMAIKRYAEFRELTREQAVTYRKSFRFYSERTLLVSILFYGTSAMLFLGAFIARYRLELILCFCSSISGASRKSSCHRCRSPKLRKAVNIVRVTMLQDSPHISHFKRLLDFGEGQVVAVTQLFSALGTFHRARV